MRKNPAIISKLVEIEKRQAKLEQQRPAIVAESNNIIAESNNNTIGQEMFEPAGVRHRRPGGRVQQPRRHHSGNRHKLR